VKISNKKKKIVQVKPILSIFYMWKVKNQLAEYDIVGMFAENLVEVGYVWWFDSGKLIFFSNSSKKYSTLKLLIVSINNFCSARF
jgi:hypothetical protein